MKFPRFLLLAVTCLAVATVFQGCGYSSASLNKSGMTKLFIPVFKNNSYEPNIGSLVTTTVIKNFQRDGSFTITDDEDCEMILRGTISRFTLNPARYRIEDERSIREYILSMDVDYSVFRKGETKAYASGTVSGSTSFFTGDDLVNDKRQGVSFVAEKVGNELASRLSESW